ncbi:MAG: hypothetical protein AAGF12_26720 [Myxococcota bacterium]
MAGTARAYESYEGFLRDAIKTYWESNRGKRINFLALLFASQQAWGAAWDRALTPGTGKKVLMGAGGAAAVALVLRAVLGGPIGLLLTAGSLASLVALYVRNHSKVMARVKGYRELIGEYEPKYTKIIGGEGDSEQRELMVDGLMSRFLDDLDAYTPEDGEGWDEDEEDDERESLSAFERHVERKQSEEKQAEEKSAGEKSAGENEQ